MPRGWWRSRVASAPAASSPGLLRRRSWKRPGARPRRPREPHLQPVRRRLAERQARRLATHADLGRAESKPQLEVAPGRAHGENLSPDGLERLPAEPLALLGEHPAGALGEAPEQLALLPRGRLAGAEAGEMGIADHGEDAAIRPHHRLELDHLARQAHAALDQGDLRLGVEGQKRQRHPHLGVERARAGVDPMLPAQDGGQHVLHGGLAVAAGDREEPAAEAPACLRGEAVERGERILDQDQGLAGAERSLAVNLRHQRRSSPLGQGLGGEAAAVEVRAHQAHEEIPGADAGAGIRGHPLTAGFFDPSNSPPTRAATSRLESGHTA